jgi:hypothetical protein
MLSKILRKHRNNNYDNYRKVPNESHISSIWCSIEIDKMSINARIVHIGRGRFEVLDDEKGGNYVHRIIDASDVIRCDIQR